MAINMLNFFKSTHKNNQCPSCEEVFVMGVVSALESINFPIPLIQQILDEWQKLIRISPPDFLKKKE